MAVTDPGVFPALPLWSAYVQGVAVPWAQFQKLVHDWATLPLRSIAGEAVAPLVHAPAAAPTAETAVFRSTDLPIAALWEAWGWPRIETRIAPAAADRSLVEVALVGTAIPGKPVVTKEAKARTAVVAVPEVKAAAAVPRQYTARPEEVDDLRHLYGVGPQLEKLLHRLGIWQFRQVAAWTREDVAFFDEKLESFRGRIDRDHWIRSAIEEHYKKYGVWLGAGKPRITLPDTDR
jgi:predicted flap endonuclease-1-like 5' DNA nuclease